MLTFEYESHSIACMKPHVFKTFRETHGLSQRELGAMLELTSTQGAISHYETGRRGVPPHLAHKFLSLALDYGDVYVLEDVYPSPEVA